MPFVHQRSITFPAFCVLRVTHCLKMLACRSFFSNNFPWLCHHREGTHTQREKQTNIQMSVPSSFLCRRDPVILGLSGKFLDTAGTETECEPGSWTLLAKLHFLSVDPKMMWPSNFLKIYPIALFLLVPISLVKPLGFLKQAGGLQFLAARSFPVAC